MAAKRDVESLVGDLTHALRLMVHRLRAEAGGDGLSLSESAALRRLDTDGAMTTAELARAENVRPQSMSATVATLEHAGMVRRRPHPTDGRQVLLELTDEGAALRAHKKLVKRTWIAGAVAQLSDEEQAVLFRAAGLLKRLAEQ
jgi:DNA-binding MarR family transcriptional regulator